VLAFNEPRAWPSGLKTRAQTTAAREGRAPSGGWTKQSICKATFFTFRTPKVVVEGTIAKALEIAEGCCPSMDAVPLKEEVSEEYF
jgi:hypothetical protein